MQKRLLALILLVTIIAFPLAFAQNEEGNGQGSTARAEGSEHAYGRRHFDPATRTQRLTKRLNLTPEQQPKVLEILKSEQSQMESLRSDSSLSQQDRRSKMMDIRKSSDDQLRGLLNSDQQKQWEQMQSRREQWQGHHHNKQTSPDSAEQQ
jgi:periplasmic protein CpxP/Spy